MMRFQADDSSIFRLLMGFLKEKGLYETLNSLQLEIGLAEEELGTDLLYLQQLVLKGRWDDVLQYIKPFNDKSRERFEELEYIVHHQQFLEALSWQGGGGHRHALLPWKADGNPAGEMDGELEVEVVVELLKSLEKLCPSQEFNSLCLCLTLERLSDNPDFSTWSVSEGRLTTFQRIKQIVFRENPRADDDRSSGSGLLSMLAMGLAYQVQTQDSLKGHTQRELGSAGMETVFNGGILVPECISVESLNRDGQHAPCIIVKDPVTNQLYGRENSINTSNTAKTGAAVVSSQTLRQTSNYDEKSDGIVGNRTSLYTSDVNTYDPQTYCAEPIIHRDAPSSSSAINHRDNISNQNSNVNQSPDKKVTRAAPVAWTVEVEPRREKDEDSARAGEGRLSRRSSFRQSRSTAETAPDIKSDVNASKVKNPTLSSSDQNQRSSPNTAASKSIASRVAESTVNYRVDSTSGARSDESKYVADELSIGQSPYEGREMRSSVIYQTDCPLRCVRMLSDDYGPSQQLSSSWMFAMGSNDKSVKIARVSDTASNQPPIVEIVREFSDVHRGSIYAMDWSSPGQGQGQGQGGLLATASNDKAVRILNVVSGALSAPMRGHTGTIRSVAFSSGNRGLSPLLASAGAGDNSVRLWDVATGSSHSVLTAHADPVHGLAWLNGSGDSEGLILSGCERGSIIAHDSRSRNPAWTLNLNLNSVLAEGGGAGVCCFSSATATSDSSYAESCDSLVVAGCTSGFICVINATRRSIAAVHKPHTDDVRSVAILDSARIRPGSTSLRIATTSFDGLGALWSYNPHQTSFQLETMLRGHTDKILGVCCGIRNSAVEILTTGADGKAILWTEQKAAQIR